VYGISPKRARRLHDATILALRRELVDERVLRPVNVRALTSTRAKALIKYRGELTEQEFARLVFLMRNLAPAIFETGEISLREALYGSPSRETALFPDGCLVQSSKFMTMSAPARFALENLPATPASDSDFTRNLAILERGAKRSFSLARAIRGMIKNGRLDGLEQEVHDELVQITGRGGDSETILAPLESLSRDLDSTAGSGGPLIPTRIEDQILPFLRNASVIGKYATIISNLPPGPARLPRMLSTAGVSWLNEIGPAPAATGPTFDNNVLLSPSLIAAEVAVSRQLIVQSAPDISREVVKDISKALGAELDRCALNGSGISPEPTGVLSLPVNPPGTYAYNARCPDITFAGPAKWQHILQMELELETARISDDSSMVWIAAPDVKNKWAQAEQVTGYPRYLWEGNTINGKPAISTFQLPPGKIIYGRFSDIILASWQSLEVLINPFSLASQGLVQIRVSMLAAINFKYCVAFASSADSASQ
jgi:HK97 family phage major capsid protein